MEMQCELLVSNISDPKTIQRMKEIIGHISDGSSSYCADALKLGLQKAFELKKQKKQPPGVLLYCSLAGCPWTTPTAYSSAGSHPSGHCIPCSNSGHSRYLLCAGCGRVRFGVHASCQGCAQRFV